MPIDFAKGIATTVVNQGLRKVAGNVPGLLGKIRGKQGVRDSSDFADIENAKTSGVSPKLLQFPSDIDSDPGVGNHGHYIIFYINDFEKTQLRFGDFVPEEGKKNLQKEETQRRITEKVTVPKTVGGQVQNFSSQDLIKRSLEKGRNVVSDAQGYDSRNFVKMENIQNQFKDDTLIQRRQGNADSQ